MAKHSSLLTCLLLGVVTLPAPARAGQQPAEQSADTFTISGRVINSRGEPPRDLLVWLCSVDGDGGQASGYPLEADGSFALRRQIPGRYVVAAAPGLEPDGIPPGFEGGVRTEVVTVTDHDVTGLVIRTHPSVSVRGHIRYDEERPGTPRPEISLLSFVALAGLPTTGVGSSARVQSDGTFVFNNVFGPSIIRAGYMLPPGTLWFDGPILLNGRDITNVPVEFENEPNADVEVVFTQRYSGLTGRVTDLAGLPSPAAFAIVFSSDRTLWEAWSTTTTVARADDNGLFWVGAPPGNYLAVAFPVDAFRSPAEAKRDFEALARLATPVEIVANRRAHLELTIRSLPKPRERR